jgi:hypothetical protein
LLKPVCQQFQIALFSYPRIIGRNTANDRYKTNHDCQRGFDFCSWHHPKNIALQGLVFFMPQGKCKVILDCK